MLTGGLRQQCRAEVTLMGGAHRAVRVGERGAWAGPRRKRGGRAQMNSNVPHRNLSIFKRVQTNLIKRGLTGLQKFQINMDG
jgi:hypothetical protein